MEPSDFLPLIALVVFALIIYAMLEFFTCCLFPGTIGWAQKCGFACRAGPTARRRSRFLSIYEIYNPSDSSRFEKLFAIAKARAEAEASRIEEGKEGAEEDLEKDLPPSYDRVIHVLDVQPPSHPHSVIV